MVQTKTPDSTSQSKTLSPGHETALKQLSEELNSDIETLTLHEGTHTGKLYIEEETTFHCVTVTADGLQVTQTPTIDEPSESLAHIQPDETETVQDAIDSLTFAGD